jgi:hypothetical protein
MGRGHGEEAGRIKTADFMMGMGSMEVGDESFLSG